MAVALNAGKREQHRVGRAVARVCCVLLAMAVAAALFLPAKAFADGTKERIVRVACGINNSLYLDEDGVAQGYCADYLNALANLEHWQLSYVEGTWNDSLKALIDGDIDLLFPTQKTTEREESLAFSELCGGYQPIGLFTTDDTALYNDYAAYNGARIAVSKGSSNEQALQEFAREHHFSYVPVYLNAAEEKLEAVKREEADYLAIGTQSDLDGFTLTAVLSYQPFYYAVNKADVELMRELDSGMAQLAAQQPQLAAGVFESFLHTGGVMAMTAEENAWLAAHEKIVVGVYRDTPPLYHDDEDGTSHGIYVDWAVLLQDCLGIKVELYPISRDSYAYDLLENGTIDFVLGSNDSGLKAQKNAHYCISSPVMEYTTVALSRHDYQPADNTAPVIVLTEARQYWVPLLLNDYPNATIRYCENAKDCLIDVQAGRADMTILNAWEFNYQSKNARFADLIEWENNRSDSEVVMASLAGGDDAMVSLVNKAIGRIDADQISSIVAANLNRSYDTYSWADRLYAYRAMLVLSAALVAAAACAFTAYRYAHRKYVHRLEQANAELEAANQTKTQFLSRMSHELRTPLNAIAGYAHLLQQSYRAASQSDCAEAEQVRAIQDAEQYLLSIIDGILDTQQIESGRIAMEDEVYNASDYLHSVIGIARAEARDAGVQFRFERRTHYSEYYRGDGVHARQVLINLLHNAIKFTPKGGTVTLTAEAKPLKDSETMLLFIVSDTGIGMSREFMETQLFHPFAQENTGIDSPYDGTGVGLAFSREIARRMGGDITCESEKGRGSVFTLTICVRTVSPERAGARSAEPAEYDFSGARVLICEDNSVNQKVLRRLLESKNCAVEVAANGRLGVEAFAASAENSFSAVLMDIRMPVMDGYEAAKAIRALPRADAAEVPILAVSANAYQEDIRRSLEAGMDAHLTKPIDPARLYDELKERMPRPATQRRSCILVVDDAEVNRAVLCAALEGEFDILEAADGVEALALLHGHKEIRAVITDVQMPNMDGTALVRAMKADPALRKKIVIVNTQFGDTDKENEMLGLGVDEFLYKPTMSQLVLLRIRNALRRG